MGREGQLHRARAMLFFGLPGIISILIAIGFGLWAIRTLQTTSYFSTNMVILSMVFTDVGLILIAISLIFWKKVNDEKRKLGA